MVKPAGVVKNHEKNKIRNGIMYTERIFSITVDYNTYTMPGVHV